MRADGRPELGVALLGEALGEQEAKVGKPFVGAAGARLGRMIERAAFKREQFLIANAVWCRPPNNSEPPEEAVEMCRQYWEPLLLRPEVKVIVPMGNVALKATTGHEGILSKRGYVEWSERYQAFILPTVHPSYIMRGNSNWEAAFLYDLRHAVEVAAEGWTPIERDYLLDPSPMQAWVWVEAYKRALKFDPSLALSYDLETPDKGVGEDEVDINLGFLAGPIYRCGYAYVDPATGRTRCLSMVWDANYLPLHRELLGSAGPKVVCYRHFDNPRIAAHGVVIAGEKHDMQEMWHVLFSGLPKNLEHVAPFVCPRQPAWKHLNATGTLAFYNATDAGVEVEAYYRIRELLVSSGGWNTYYQDISLLNPILLFMSAKGMPIDEERRMAASTQLMDLKEKVRVRLNEEAQGARPKHIYKRFREGLEEVEIEVEEKYCSDCRKPRVGAAHPCFKSGSAPGEVPLGDLRARVIVAKGWSKPLDFKPSQKGLVRYAEYRGYKLYTRWDRKEQVRKVTMDENALRHLALNYPEDKVFLLALEERELTKLLGTYAGYLVDTPEPPHKTGDSLWWEVWRKSQYRAELGDVDEA